MAGSCHVCGRRSINYLNLHDILFLKGGGNGEAFCIWARAGIVYVVASLAERELRG